MTFTDIQASVTRTAAANGSGVDISGITEDFTLVLEILSFTANAGQTPTAQFTFEDSVNAFTNQIVVATFNQKGAVNADGKQHGMKQTWRKRDLVGLRAGTGSAVLRCSLASIGGTGASITYKAYLQRVS
jgi:hypothetical protein